MSKATTVERGVGVRRFKPYPAYKESGVGWLGEIPTHWSVGRLKALLSLSREKNGAKPVGEMLSVSGYRGVELKEYDFEERKRTVEELAEYRVVREGQLVVNTMWLNYAGLGVSPYEGHVSPAYRCYSIQHIYDRDYLHHLVRSDIYVGRYCALLYGIRPNSLQIKNHDWDDLELLVPPQNEQRAIAAFLDRETANIDALVAKNERLTDLLQERRTALITRAVTKGLNPNAPMKESGVEWLGEIPAHWTAERIKWAARMESGHTPDKKVESYWRGGDIPWVSLADTEQLREVDYIANTAVMTTSDGIAHSSAHLLPVGTVIFSRDATIGLCAITRLGMAVSQHFIGWVCNSRLQPEYLLLVLRSMTQELERLTMGATVRTIGMPDVRSLITPIPPIPEQEKIVLYVKQQGSRIDALIDKIRKGIKHLKEYRVAPISAAVTGKIDVREEAP